MVTAAKLLIDAKRETNENIFRVLPYVVLGGKPYRNTAFMGCETTQTRRSAAAKLVMNVLETV